MISAELSLSVLNAKKKPQQNSALIQLPIIELNLSSGILKLYMYIVATFRGMHVSSEKHSYA